MTTATPKAPTVSFEFSPPDPASGDYRALDRCADRLGPLAPMFMSVTYGAGGSQQERTVAALAHLAERTDTPLAGHLTCVGARQEEIHEVVDAYVALGVTRLVALRGDAPIGTDGIVEGGYETAADLVAGIRARPDGSRFDISVAGYPEVHPRAASPAADLENLRRKVDAGADRVITQFFFDNARFLRFRDDAADAGVDVPVVPGIMPIWNFGRLVSFADRCASEIPGWLHERFDGLDEVPDVRRLVAAAVLTEQCTDLVRHGAEHIHFFTMNQANLTAAACRVLGVGVPVPTEVPE